MGLRDYYYYYYYYYYLCVVCSEYCNKFMGSIISHLICSVKLVLIDMTAAPACTTTTKITSPVNDDRKLIYSFHFCIAFTCWSLPLRLYSCSFLSFCRYSSPRILATALDSLCVPSIPAVAILRAYCYWFCRRHRHHHYSYSGILCLTFVLQNLSVFNSPYCCSACNNCLNKRTVKFPGRTKGTIALKTERLLSQKYQQ
jgi:hypothetical protein